MTSDLMDSLRTYASTFGISLSDAQLEIFRAYLEELLAWNRHMNLTGLSTRERMLFELFLDSLLPVPHLHARGALLDVGSGAGFPGLPIRICQPGLATCLIESNNKKVSFLKQIVRLLKLEDVNVVRGRIEKDGATLSRKDYDVVTARGLAGLSQVVEWCAPFVSPGGVLVGFLGPSAGSELKASEEVIMRHGLTPDRMIPYILPNRKTHRNLLLLRKRLSP